MIHVHNRWIWKLSAWGLLALFLATCSGKVAFGEGGEKPKVILLGFDGVDIKLADRFIDEGHLPNLKKLRESGTVSPLETVNPAQSPVAWASIVTGTNPGKTNIGGFIRRNFQHGSVTPQLATVEESYGDQDHQIPFSEISWLNRESKTLWLSIFAAAVFLTCLIILKLLLRLGGALSLVGSLVLAAVAAFFGLQFFNELPENVPFPYNLQQGENFWDTLADNQIRTVGLYAPGAYPVVAPKDAEILGGLGVPDVNGGTGTWYVYSSETFTFFDRSTNTGGKIYRLNEAEGNRLTGRIFGPSNFYKMDEFKKQVEGLKARKDDSKLTASERDAADEEYRKKENEFKDWKSEEAQKKANLEFFLTPDYENRSMQFELEGKTVEVKEGDWSDWFQVKFKLSPFLKVPALVRLRLIKCSDEEVRFFVPAIDISPEAPPDYLRLSSPADYSSKLVEQVGLFETVGWACITHGLKDEEISEKVFMEDVEFTIQNRRKLFDNELARKDWDVFFEVFYTTDRVQHMMYRLFDEAHPQYDPELAQEEVTFFGKQVKFKDCVLEAYRIMDDIIGGVMKRIEAGEFGDGATLMVVSDHGFAPFYYGMNLNTFLAEKGFLALPPDGSGKPRTVKSVVDSGQDNYLMFVDWDKTRAYSLGLGKVFINLKGREPKGVVDPKDYDRVRDEIIRELEAFVDPNTGEKVVKKVYKREEIFSGDFWKEGDVDFTFYKPDGKKFAEKRYTEGFADLYIGFYPKYRVSWQTSLGGIEDGIIGPNDQKWSGDHVSVDPSEVKGIFISNRKIRGTRPPCLTDLVPTIMNIYGLKSGVAVDGEPILLE